MKAKLLFPSYFRMIGWILATPGFVLGYFVIYQDYKIPGFGLKLRGQDGFITPAFENFTNELALILVIIGLLFIAFAKMKREDELTASLRLNALYWAILINYIAYGVVIALSLSNLALKSLAISNLLDPISDGLNVLVYNLFFPLVVFICRFYYLLYRSGSEYQIKTLRFLPYKPFNVIGKWLSLALLLICFVCEFILEIREIENVYMFVPFVMLLWVYSKQKSEDEYINKIRLDAMQIAVYANYVILLVSTCLFYSILYLYVIYFNLVTIPVIFVIIFHYRLYKLNHQIGDRPASQVTLGIL